MQEELYFSICIDALKDFRNVFSNQFLRDNSGKLSAYTHTKVETDTCAMCINPSKDIIIVFDHDPMVKNNGVIFRFPGDGYVYISNGTGKENREFACKCEPNINSRDHISDMVYETLGVTIILQEIDIWATD